MVKIDADTAKKVMDILSDPEMMSKISALASGISHPPKEPVQPPIPDAVSTSLNFNPTAFSNSPSPSGSKSELLMALKPLLKENKQSKVDAIIKALTVATAVSKIKGGGTGNV